MTPAAQSDLPPQRSRPVRSQAAASKRPALRERTLRFTGDAVLLICAANILLLATMFWVGFLNGKRAARAELKVSASLAGGDSGEVGPLLRSDGAAKADWEAPSKAVEPDPAEKEAAKPQPSPPPVAAADKAAEPPKPAATEKKWVVLAVSYELGQRAIAEQWKQTLKDKQFDGVELYQLGKERPMIGLCIGEAPNKQDLDAVLKRVQEFADRNGDDHPFAGAVPTLLEVKRR